MTRLAHRLVVIGGSWGGLAAVRSILSSLTLPADTAAVIVLHRQPVRSSLTQVLDRAADLPVEEADDKAALSAGKVLVAPPDYHLLVERSWVALSTDAPVKYSRPSIDVTMDTAATSFGDRVVAVLLTGASDDGTDGARRVRRNGGTVIVQDPATAEQATMPRSAIDAGLAHEVVALRELPAAILAALRDAAQGEEGA